MYATIDIIENFDWYQNMPNFESFDLRYYGIRTLYVILTGVIACIVPKFGLFMNFFGALSGTALCILIPVLIYEKVYKGEISIPHRILNVVIVFIGVVFGGLSTVLSLWNLLVALFQGNFQ